MTGPYVSLGGGVDFTYDQTVRPFGFGPAPHTYTFDPAAAAEATLGFGFGNGLRIEAEGKHTDNHVHGTVYPSYYGSLRAGGYEQQYGGFGNVLYDLPFRLPVRPYIGLGAGYQDVELDHVTASAFGGPSGHLVETRGNFAYQAIAGLAVPSPVPGLLFTAEYRFIGVLLPGPCFRGDHIAETPVPVLGGAPAFGSQGASGGGPNLRYERSVLAEHATFNNIFDNERAPQR